MKEKALIILSGYCKAGLHSEKERSKIIGILEPTTGIFKGVEVVSSDCNIQNCNDLLEYIYDSYLSRLDFSLIVGYYNGKILKYQTIIDDKDISYGNFELDENEGSLIGRERTSVNGRLVRNLNRPTNRYSATVLTSQVFGVQKTTAFTQHFDSLYEIIESVLMKANENGIWKGIQISVECTFPKISRKTYMISPTRNVVIGK